MYACAAGIQSWRERGRGSIVKIRNESLRKNVRPTESKDWFGPFANTTTGWLGSRWGFGAAAVFVLVWAFTGPIFHYSDTWQLIINSVTNIVTFLMVFLLQNTQNRDAKAINLKLDELIYSISSAKNQMIDIEKLSDRELDEMAARYETIRNTVIARKRHS
jgi:low affinity Fe/Cu permease